MTPVTANWVYRAVVFFFSRESVTVVCQRNVEVARPTVNVEHKNGQLVMTILKCRQDRSSVSCLSLSFFLNARLFGPGGVVCLFVPLVSDIGSTAGPRCRFSSYAAACVPRTLCPRGTRPSVHVCPSVGLSLSLSLSPPPPPVVSSPCLAAACFYFGGLAARRPPTEPPSDPLHLADVDVKAAVLTH